MNLFFLGGMGTLLLIGLPVAFALALLAIAGMYFLMVGLLLLCKFLLSHTNRLMILH